MGHLRERPSVGPLLLGRVYLFMGFVGKQLDILRAVVPRNVVSVMYDTLSNAVKPVVGDC